MCSILLVFLCLVFNPVTGRCLENSPNAEEKSQQIKDQLDDIKKTQGLAVIRIFESSRPSQALSFEQRKERERYLQLEKDFLFWDAAGRLKQSLLFQYEKINKPDEAEKKEVEDEANALSVLLIENIQRLKKEYGINSFAITHNLLIQVGLKKRGACKHWAEDLLKAINTIPHPHFVGYWGEAHPGSMREHNVAILAPKNGAFEEGVLIDPWRTAGKPFWAVVSQDNHPWHPWPGYPPR